MKLALSNSIKQRGGEAWSPDSEASLEAWYQNAVGITLSGSDVSVWADSSSNSYDMIQLTLTEQPAYSAGVLTFASSDVNNLGSASQIQLSGDFSIGVKLNLLDGGGVLLADNTVSNGEFIRFTSTSQMRVRIDATTAVNIEKDSGTWIEDAYMVLTRESDVLTLHWNGTAQDDTETKSGTIDIDHIGVRLTNANPIDAEISEIQIYSSASAGLTTNINNRLSTL